MCDRHTGTRCADSQRTSGQAREEVAASVNGYTGQRVRERVRERVCSGTTVHYEQTVRSVRSCPHPRPAHRHECVRVHRYTMSKQSGLARARAWPKCASVYRFTGTL